jgi:hypothetical protein
METSMETANMLMALLSRCIKSQSHLAKAAATLVKHPASKRENISTRAAESIIEYTQKALEHEELERRIERWKQC